MSIMKLNRQYSQFAFLSACTFFMFCSGLKAQDWSGMSYAYYQNYPGYIITNAGDTVKGFVEHGDRTRNQNKCIFYTDVKDRKTKKTYKPDELKGYAVGDKVYRSMHYSGGLFSKPLNFVLAVKPGRITQCTYYTKDEGYIIQVRKINETDAQYDERICKAELVWYKEGEDPISNPTLLLGFAKKVSKLVADYPELAKKVENKEKGYTTLKILDIIDEYNNWWAAKQ